MAKIQELKIKNFRGIKEFFYTFNNKNLICLVGRGDSGKTTILDAISYVLSSSWNLTFFDSDFYKCDINTPIEIEVTLIDLPENLILENKYGLYIRGLDKSTSTIKDDLENDHEKALTIKLEINKDLEPKWCVINNRQNSPTSISAYDRAKLNVFMISDYIDRHFSWSKGNPLYSLLKQQKNSVDSEGNNIIIEALREAKSKIDNNSFVQFEEITGIVKSKADELGIDISNTSTSIDFKNISVKDGRVCLHDDKIPFRLKGKGTKRLISIAIQMLLVGSGGIMLIDEIEQGLEPDRVKHLVRTFYKEFKGQIFIATHSQSVIEELEVQNILIINNEKGNVKCEEIEEEFQDVIRACPEAVYAKKVIICEGKTEIGICKALDSYRIKKGKSNMSSLGVVYTGGGGDNFYKRASKLKELGKKVCVLCDSDKSEIIDKKNKLRDSGIKVIDCKQSNAIENQVFNDLPWDAIRKLIIYEEKKSSEKAVEYNVNSRFTESLTTNWQQTDSTAKREALGKTAKDSRWFKQIAQGEYLGTVIFGYFDQIKDKELGKQFGELSKWIDDD